MTIYSIFQFRMPRPAVRGPLSHRVSSITWKVFYDLSLLGYSRISNLFQAHFWDFLEIACWYWPDLARIQASKLGLGITSNGNMNFKLFQLPENPSSMLSQWR